MVKFTCCKFFYINNIKSFLLTKSNGHQPRSFSLTSIIFLNSLITKNRTTKCRTGSSCTPNSSAVLTWYDHLLGRYAGHIGIKNLLDLIDIQINYHLLKYTQLTPQTYIKHNLICRLLYSKVQCYRTRFEQ